MYSEFSILLSNLLSSSLIYTTSCSTLSMAGRSFWPNSQNWRRYWPGCAVALLATLQLFVSFAIVGLQIGIVTLGVLSDCYGATARFIVGFVCWGFFFVGWISLFSVCKYRNSITLNRVVNFVSSINGECTSINFATWFSVSWDFRRSVPNRNGAMDLVEIPHCNRRIGSR